MSSESDASLPLESLERIDQVCVAFEESWNQGVTPQLEEFLQRVSQELRSRLFTELLFIELEHRKHRSEFPSRDEYRKRFSEHVSVVDQVFSEFHANERTTRADGREVIDGLVGETIKYVGNYQVTSEIARGGMGAVFKARQKGLERPVALKMILKGRLATASDLERFQRESKAVAKLRHPNIINIHEVGVHEGCHYFTMDFIEGDNLALRLRNGSIAPRKAAELIQTLAKAIQYAHQQGVLHRDLKPANVLIDPKGNPVLTDFGLAKPLEDTPDSTADMLTQTGQVLGTPSYMSPEQAMAKHQLVGVASDVYSLGAILYACLAGHAPFLAESSYETIRQVIHKEPVSLRLLNPSIPKDLESICLKCLEKEPHQRYATAEQLADDLGNYLNGRPVLARPISATTKAWRWAKRNRAVAVLLALSVVLLFAVTISSSLLAYVSRQSEIAADEAAREAAQLAEDERRQRKIAEEAQRREARQRRIAEQQGRRAQWKSYVSSLQPMQEAWAKNDFGQLETLLKDSIPGPHESDFRGWEWYYLQDQVNQASTPLGGHEDLVGLFSYDPLHNRILALSKKGKWQLRSVVSDEMLSEVVLENARTVKLSPDGLKVAWGTNDGRIHIADLETGKVKLNFEAYSESLLPDDPELPRPYGPTALIFVDGLAWSQSGDQIASISRAGKVCVWDTSDGRLKKQLRNISEKTPNMSYHGAPSLDWHPDSGIAASLMSGEVMVWSSDLNELRWSHEFDRHVPATLKWNPEGTKLLYGAGGPSSVLFDDSGNQIRELKSGGGVATWIDSDRFAVGSKFHPVCLLFDVRSPETYKRLMIATESLRSLASTEDGELLIGSKDGRIRRVDLTTPFAVAEMITAHEGGALSVSWSPNGESLATVGADGALRIWDASTSGLKKEIKELSKYYLWDVKWNPDGKTVAISDGEKVFLVDPITEEVTASMNMPPTETHPASNQSTLAWRPDGKQLAIGTQCIDIVTSSLKNPLQLLPQERYRWSCDFSPDGRYLGAVEQTGIVLCEVTTGRRMYFQGNDDGDGASWSSDGHLFAAGGKPIHIIDTATFETVSMCDKHRYPVNDLELSPSGDRLVSIDAENLMVWDTATGDLLLKTTFFGWPEQVTWSPDGRRIALTTEKGYLRILGSTEMPAVKKAMSVVQPGDIDLNVSPKVKVTLADLESQIQTDPNNLVVRRQLADELAKLFRWERALNELQQIISRDSDNDEVAPIGLIFAIMANDENAQEQFKQICIQICQQRVVNEETVCLAALALSLSPEDDLDRVSLFHKTTDFAAISSEWRYQQPYFLCGVRFGRVYQLSTALRLLPEYRSPQTNANICLMQGIIAFNEKQLDTARQKLFEARAHLAGISTRRTEFPVDFAVGSVLYDELERKIRLIPKVESPENKEIGELTNQLWSLATNVDPSRRDPERALLLAQQVVDLKPKDPNHWDNLGVALLSAGKVPHAIEALELAREMRQGRDPYHQAFLAMAYFRDGRQDEAFAEYIAHCMMLVEDRVSAEQYQFRNEAEQTMGIEFLFENLSQRLEQDPTDVVIIRVYADFLSRHHGSAETIRFWQNQLSQKMLSGEDLKDVFDDITKNDEVYEAIVRDHPDNQGLLLSRADLLARSNRWREAAAIYENTEETEQFAAMLLLAGEERAYQDLCRNEIKGLVSQESPDPIACQRVAEICSFSQIGDCDWGQIVEWAERAESSNSDRSTKRILAGALYRSGEYDRVIRVLNVSHDSLFIEKTPSAFLMASTHARLGNAEEAKRWYAFGLDAMKAIKRTSDKTAAWEGNAWARINVWRHEADIVVKSSTSTKQDTSSHPVANEESK